MGVKCYQKNYLGWRPKILLHDYRYWKQKWGFDILNPDMNVVKSKYAGTEILWNYDPKMKAEGEAIIKNIRRTKMEQNKQAIPVFYLPMIIMYHIWRH